MSEEANARLRERRATDPEYRQRENAAKMRYVLRKKAELAGEAIPQEAELLAKAEDPCDKWLRDGILLNSDDPDQAAAAKRSIIHRFETMANLSSAERERVAKASAFYEPKEEKKEEAEESFGLADDR